MKFFHIADLHFGKSIYKVSMLEDQEYWMKQFVDLAAKEKVDAVVIAGDVYDRGTPSDGAVRILDKMLTMLSEYNIPVLMVAGNHDSSQKLAFGSRFFKKQGIHISNPLENSKTLNSITMNDKYGPVTFWLMPYVYPALIGKALDREDVKNQNYEFAVQALLTEQQIDFTQRNVLVAHQNVTKNGEEAERGGSESTVGGVGKIDYTAFEKFDYVALGHIHSNYCVGKETIRYAGSPMCYHFDETRQPDKGPILVEIGPKGEEISAKVIKIPSLHPMRELKGTLAEIPGKITNMEKELKKDENNKARGAYVKIIVTDQPIRPEISNYLRDLLNSSHSILMEITSEYNRSFGNLQEVTYDKIKGKSVEELFGIFFAERSEDNEMPDDKDRQLLQFAGELQEKLNNNTEETMDELADELLDYLKKQEEV